MPVYIHAIQTAVPSHVYDQNDAREFMKEHVQGRDAIKRIIHSIYARSGIEHRHSVIEDFAPDNPGGIFVDKETGALNNPTTRERNDLYTSVSRGLHQEVLEKALHQADKTPADLTHLITVSCTGFHAPGPDYYLIRDLALSTDIHRYHLGFMGCFAAFPGLRMAREICSNDPDAVVAVICLELCTLHLKFTEDTDNLISASVFADGCAAAIVAAEKPVNRGFLLSDMYSTITDQGEKDMAWTLDNNGFAMALSTYIPDIIEANLQPILETIRKRTNLSQEDVTWWAIHPGGRAILDKVEKSLDLEPQQMEASRYILRNYGNMSSATILFVLEHILREQAQPDDTVLAMAFGPGLTVETGKFVVVDN